jgi:GNAT superfamily N-acetyltransferase
MAQRFRECTQFVPVDVETCVKTYTKAIEDGYGAIFGFRQSWGDLVGALACVKGPDLHFPRMLAVETFWYVLPESHGFGIGKQLFSAFRAWAKDEKCDFTAMIHLVDSYPDSLEDFYIRSGYKLVEKHYLKAVE